MVVLTDALLHKAKPDSKLAAYFSLTAK